MREEFEKREDILREVFMRRCIRYVICEWHLDVWHPLRWHTDEAEYILVYNSKQLGRSRASVQMYSSRAVPGGYWAVTLCQAVCTALYRSAQMLWVRLFGVLNKIIHIL